MLPIVGNRVGPGGVDHNGAVKPVLLLCAGMAVVPIGARLDDWKLVDEGRPGLDTGEADPGHAIHRKRYEQPVPVDRAFHVELVRYGQTDALTFL